MPYGFLFKILQLITVYANKYSQSFFLDIFLSFTFWHCHNLLSLKNNSKFLWDQLRKVICHFLIRSFFFLSCRSSFFSVITFQVIQTYSRYSAVPRKLLIGKRLAQCLHPALPSGVHLKALESYDLIFTQIGANRLAQDLFIYTSGLFPLLSQASMSVKPVLLDLYETHLLPLRKKLYPGLSGFLLALLPGIEEVSEYTER